MTTATRRTLRVLGALLLFAGLLQLTLTLLRGSSIAYAGVGALFMLFGAAALLLGQRAAGATSARPPAP